MALTSSRRIAQVAGSDRQRFGQGMESTTLVKASFFVKTCSLSQLATAFELKVAMVKHAKQKKEPARRRHAAG